MAERVTVEHNGERITLEVPDGTSDEQIQQYLSGGAPKQTFGEQLSKEVSSITDKPTAMGKTTGVTDVLNRGLVAGALGGPVDLINMGLQGTDWLANKITGAIRPSAVPYLPKLSTEKPVGGSEWFGQQLQNVGAVTPERRPILEAGTGLVGGLVAPVRTATGTIRPLGWEAGAQMIDAGKDVVQAVKPAVMAPINAVGQTTRGVIKGATGTGDALIPLGDTYIPPEIIARVKAGEIPFSEAQKYAKPISELPSNPVERAALAVAGKQFPVEGRGFEAFGQRLGQTYEEKPWKLAVDVGIPAMTGLPISPFSMGRGLQASADWLLSRKGFSPMSEIEAMRAQPKAAPGQQSFNFNQPVAPVEPTVKAPTVAPVAPEFTNAPKIEIKGVGQNPDVMQMTPEELFGRLKQTSKDGITTRNWTEGNTAITETVDNYDVTRTIYKHPEQGTATVTVYPEGGQEITISKPGVTITSRPDGRIDVKKADGFTDIFENGQYKYTVTSHGGVTKETTIPTAPDVATELASIRSAEGPIAPAPSAPKDVMNMETGLPSGKMTEFEMLPTKEIIQDPVVRGLYEKQTKNGTEITYTDANKKVTEVTGPESTGHTKLEWTNGKEWNGSRIEFDEPNLYEPTSITHFTREGGPQGKSIKESTYYYDPAEMTKEVTIVDHKKKETIKVQWQKDWDTEEWSAYATKNGKEDPKLSKKYTTTEPEELFPELKAYLTKD